LATLIGASPMEMSGNSSTALPLACGSAPAGMPSRTESITWTSTSYEVFGCASTVAVLVSGNFALTCWMSVDSEARS
jgi:hypothetical protein